MVSVSSSIPTMGSLGVVVGPAAKIKLFVFMSACSRSLVRSERESF